MDRREQFTRIYTALLANPNCGDITNENLISKAAFHMRSIVDFEKRVETDPEFRMLWLGIDAESLEQAVSARERHIPTENPDGTA